MSMLTVCMTRQLAAMFVDVVKDTRGMVMSVNYLVSALAFHPWGLEYSIIIKCDKNKCRNNKHITLKL